MRTGGSEPMGGLLRMVVAEMLGTFKDALRDRARRRELERERAASKAVEAALRKMAGMGDAAVKRIDEGVEEITENMRRLTARCSDPRCKLRPGHIGAHDDGDSTWGR